MKMEEEENVKEMEMEMEKEMEVHHHEKESTSTSGTGHKTVPFFKLFRFADVYDVGMMVIGSISAIGNGMGMPLMSLLLGQLIHAFSTADHSHVVPSVSKVALKFVYLAIGIGVASFLQVSCWMITGERQAGRVRVLYLNTILKQDMAFFDTETTTGEVIERMTGDTVLIQDAIGEKFGKSIQLLSTFFGGFAIAFTEGWLLSLVMLSCVPALFIAGFIMSICMTKMSSKGQAAYVEAGIVVEQTIGAIRTVASFTGEHVAIERYNRSIGKAYLSTVQQAFVSGLGLGVFSVIIYSCYGLATWYGAKLIIDKGYKGGQIISVMIAFTTGGMSLGQASPCFNSFAAGKAAAYRMFEVIKRKPLIDASDKNGIILEEIKGDIELKDIYFSYPARPNAQIFSGFSLHIPSGTTVALVGQSGSGKSTVINLVERFYDPEAGEVLIDGINLKKLQLKWIRETIGLVSQEPLLFATTLRENIMYGKEHATDEEIRTAIELGNAAKFIDELPKGLETIVSEHGVQLSGGQKQRIAISRAILKNPKILLLDEATSALDVESEHIVQDALERIMLNRTTVVVAHRLTTIRTANIIAVVHQGKIVEQGTHSDLSMNSEGAYSQLIHLQEDAKGANDPESWGLENKIPSFDTEKYLSKDTDYGGKTSSLTSGLPGNSIVHHETKTSGNSSFEIEQDEEVHNKFSARRLAYINNPEIPVLLLGSIAAAIQGVTSPLFGILFSTTIKIFYEPPHTLRKDSNFWSLMYITLGCVGLVVIPVQQYLFGVAGGKLIRRIRSMCFEKVVHQEISWFDDPANSSGAISARLSTDASTVRNLVGDALSLMVQNISTITAALIIAFIANWRLALIVLALLPLMGLEGYAQVKFLQGFGSDVKVMYEEASQVASDAVSGIRTVASFCSEQKVIDLYQNKCKDSMKHGVRSGVVSGAGFGFAHFALYSTAALCFYAGAHLVKDGKGSVEQIFKVFFALIVSAMTISQTSALAPDSSKAKGAVVSILKILDTKPKIDSGSDLGMTLDSVRGDIEFFKISFTYPTRPDVQILQDFCLSIPSGKTVALVGESGCGKSTIISLLERFYEPNSGDIFLDGVEIKKLKISWLRQQMGLVSQEPVLFNETIRTNIAYGKPGITSEEEIIAATKASNAYNFISALPQGFDTFVGERGVQMSGGQKQRIAIARAILKDPKILLLDEATSALDAESERVVQDAFDRIMINRTTIVVAHRLSTIKGADIIAVVKNGKIVEKGKHEELIRIADGAYASLVAIHSSFATTTIVVAHRLSTIKGADIIAVVKNGIIVEKGKHEELIRIADGAYASLVALHSNSAM